LDHPVFRSANVNNFSAGVQIKNVDHQNGWFNDFFTAAEHHATASLGPDDAS
jgi:hypothetical protein